MNPLAHGTRLTAHAFLAAALALSALASLPTAALAGAIGFGPGPAFRVLPDGDIQAPQLPSTFAVHGPVLPTEFTTKPVVFNMDPKGVVGPRPPKDGMRETLLELLYGGGPSPSALKLNIVVPDGMQSTFAGLEAELEGARPTTAVTLQFITPQQMNSCSVSVGVPGPGGGTTNVNTCNPHALPARPAGEAVAWYVGLFDLWAFADGGQTYDLSPYIYSLINASDMLYIDTTGLDRVQFDPGVATATPQQARFSVQSFEFETNASRELLGARFVQAQGIPEPATALLALLAVCGLAASRRRSSMPA